MNLTLVIPTHNRPQLFKRLLNQLNAQTYVNFVVIVIDSSYKFFSNINYQEFKNLNTKNKFFFHSFDNGTSLKRNRGFRILEQNKFLTNWILYLDDDIFFKKDFLENLSNSLKKIEGNNNIAALGVKINQNNENFATKKIRLFSKFFNNVGIYPSDPGRVSSSGWHSPHSGISNLKKIDWLPSGLLVVNYKYNKLVKFDNYFSDYGYLEDLDFTYSLSKIGSLSYLPDLIVNTNFRDRSDYLFGNNEIINRFYFVKKHKLSTLSFSLMVTLRLIYSLLLGIFKLKLNMVSRFFGNINAIINILLKRELSKKSSLNIQKNLNILIDFSSSIHGGGASFLFDLAYSYYQKPGININILSTNLEKGLLNISNKYYKCPKLLFLKFFYLKVFFYFNYKKFDFVVSGTSNNIRNNTIFISQNNISIDRFIVENFYNYQKIRQYLIRRRVLNAAKRSYLTVAPSINSKKLLLDYKCEPKNIKIIHNFSHLNRKFIDKNFDKKKLTFLYVSNYAPHKMHLNLIEAFWYLYKENYSFQLTCVGRWNFPYIQKMINASKFTKELQENKFLLLLNEKNRDEIYNLHDSNDIFIFPSVCESGSMSLLEAMKSSMPVLSSSMSSNKEYTNKSAYYFDPLSVKSIKQAIKICFNKNQHLKNLSKLSYDESKKFRSSNVINEYLMCFENK